MGHIVGYVPGNILNIGDWKVNRKQGLGSSMIFFLVGGEIKRSTFRNRITEEHEKICYHNSDFRKKGIIFNWVGLNIKDKGAVIEK